MKKGFTMIELIFVIVILGILAAVAIPRLAATRDDAELAKAATNLSTIVSDIGAYYTSKGNMSTTVSDMSNVENPIKIGTETCITVTPNTNGSITLSAIGTGTKCSLLANMSSVRGIYSNQTGSNKTISFGGSNITW